MREHWKLLLALFLLCQGLYGCTASGRVDRIADEFEVYSQAESLIDRGSLAIPQVPEAVFFGKLGTDGQPYAPYGPASAFLCLPHHLAGRAVAAATGVPRDPRFLMPWKELVAGVTSLATSTWASLAVLGLVVLALQLGASPRRAALLGLLLGAGTLHWVYATQFFSEPICAALLIWCVVFTEQRRKVPAGIALWLLLLVKASNVVLIPVVLIAAVWPRDPEARPSLERALREGWPLLVAIGAAASVRLALNAARFGDPFESGYSWAGVLRPGETHRAFLLTELPRGVFGLLLTPGKSLLLYAPPVLLAAFGWKGLYRRAPHLALTALGALVFSLLFFGSYSYWEGGLCYGPRFLVPILPLLLVPLAVGRLPNKIAITCALLLGVAVQYPGVSVSFTADQAKGGRPAGWVDPYYAWHDPSSTAIPAGRPLNRYRLDYNPFRSGGYLALMEQGRQNEFVFSRWDRIGQLAGKHIWPLWLGTVYAVVCLLLMAFGAVGLRMSLKRT